MTCLFLQGGGAVRARVWIDALPEHAILPRGLKLERRVIRSVASGAESKSVAFEVFRAHGGSFHYGLLGGSFEALETADFGFAVPVEEPVPPIVFAEPLSGKLDRVVLGGGAEYAPGIIAGIKQLDARTLPAGFLTFTCMAHGEVGSALAVFSSLARAVVRMLTRADEPASFDDAMDLLAA
jgi:hypothetical protein